MAMFEKLDEIRFEILEDGTLSVTTDGVSGANHMSADQFLLAMERVLGGEVTRKKRNRLTISANLRNAFDAHCADGHHHNGVETHHH